MDAHELKRLIADCHRTLLDFLQVDLKMGMTYVHIALTRVSDGDMPSAERAHKQAQKAFETILKFLPRLSAQDAQERKQIECGLAELKKLLAESADLIPGLHTSSGVGGIKCKMGSGGDTQRKVESFLA